MLARLLVIAGAVNTCQGTRKKKKKEKTHVGEHLSRGPPKLDGFAAYVRTHPHPHPEIDQPDSVCTLTKVPKCLERGVFFVGIGSI